MRFFLSTQQTLPAGQPREAIMDANPWTYQIMAAEMRRESKIEAVASPGTSAISDQRNYLFLAVDKDTSAATTVELPAGTTPSDVAEIVTYRVVNGAADTGAAVHVTRLVRGFFLGADYRPGSSFVAGTVDATLTAARPSATVWRSASELGA